MQKSGGRNSQVGGMASGKVLRQEKAWFVWRPDGRPISCVVSRAEQDTQRPVHVVLIGQRVWVLFNSCCEAFEGFVDRRRI